MKQKLTIVKVGGAVVEDEAQLSQLLADFAAISGPKVLVHGGGRKATKVAAQLGIETQMVEGRRITDAAMLDVVTMVYGGLVNKTIVARLQAIGISAIGLTGADAGIISSVKRPPVVMKSSPTPVDFGFVGDVKSVAADTLGRLIDMGLTPVVAPLTHDGQGHLLNTNADTMASETAKGLAALYDVTLIFALFAFILIFTNIGQGNQQIRRMRSAFNKEDASAQTREINQEAMKRYLDEAPWGIGMAVGYKNVPANNKYTFMATVPPDSEYVFIWIHTGIIGITVFLICTALMIIGACWIVLFKIKSPSLRGIGAGFTCAMISQQLGGYGNQVLLQFPNCLVFYGGLTIVYVLPYLEEEWVVFEAEQLARQEEKKRLKLEKKHASRV
jgi:acetylglutamate kinase